MESLYPTGQYSVKFAYHPEVDHQCMGRWSVDHQWDAHKPCIISDKENRSRIHERTISLRFMAIISDSRFLYTMFTLHITSQFQTTFAQGGAGFKIH
jgi:hypothetical protein